MNLIFDFSYRALDDEERRAWTALSIMPASFDRAAGRAVINAVVHSSADDESLDTGELLDRLVCLNLLEYDEVRERHGWHDLLREFAGFRLRGDEEVRARLGHAEHFIEVAWQTDSLYKQGHKHLLQGLTLFDLERAHVESAFDFLQDDASWAGQLLLLVDGVAYAAALRFRTLQNIHWLEVQAEAAHRTGYRAIESGALANLGDAYRNLSDPRKAIEYQEQSLVISREIGWRQGEGTALGNLGIAYFDLGELPKAIEYFEQDLAIRREIGDLRGEGSTLGNLGIVYANIGELHEAMKYYEQHLLIARKIGDKKSEGNAIGNLGIAYTCLGELSKAVEYHKQHLAIAREIGDSRGESNALDNLGNAYFGSSEPRKAIEYYEQQLTICREINDQRGEGNALWNSALVYEALGERRQALSLMQLALGISEAIEDPNVAQVREKLAQWQGVVDAV